VSHSNAPVRVPRALPRRGAMRDQTAHTFELTSAHVDAN
jgi:hypothetical protein